MRHLTTTPACPLTLSIFFTNVLRILDERGMTKTALSERSGVSISFLSDLTTGKANPSLKVMAAIANALDTPLPFLLESTDLDLLAVLADGKLPEGYERVSAILPEHRAFIVKKWHEETKKTLQESGKKQKKERSKRIGSRTAKIFSG